MPKSHIASRLAPCKKTRSFSTLALLLRRLLLLRFKFTRVATGEDVLLDKVDDMLCDAIGIASDPESFSSQFQLLTTVGDVVNKHGSWDEAIFQELAAKVTDADYRLTPDLVRRFLQTDLEYKCWVSR